MVGAEVVTVLVTIAASAAIALEENAFIFSELIWLLR